MADPLRPQICDQLLQPLISASSDSDVEKALTSLIQDHARPLIIGILKQKFSGWGDADCIDDLQSEATLRLLGRLRQFRQNPEEYSIWNFRDYVVTTTGGVCATYLRSRFPNRCRLRNSLMYLLTRDPSFFLKENQSGIHICGLSEWKKSDEFVDITKENFDFTKIRSTTGYHNASSLRTVITEIFAVSQAPVELNELIKLLITVLGVQESAIKNKPEFENKILEHISDNRNNPEESVENLQFLRKMWDEVKQLPVNQRVALLLNLKDTEGADLLSVFPTRGIATFREIAAVLELSLEQFTAIWKEIPLGDLKIAELIGVTRQQVINLRKSGRERLIRRAGEVHANKHTKSTSLEKRA